MDLELKWVVGVPADTAGAGLPVCLPILIATVVFMIAGMLIATLLAGVYYEYEQVSNTSTPILISAFVTGLVFAIGLGISGMTDTTKVIGFLTLNTE